MEAAKQLTAQEANKLAIEQQVILVQLTEIALLNTFNGKAFLFGRQVFDHTLMQAKNRLSELDRQREAYERNLPYLASNGAHEGKNKAHFGSSGAVMFVETKESTSGEGVKRFVTTKALQSTQFSFINKQKTKSSNEATNMATKKATAKKTASKATAKKGAAKKATAKKATAKAANKGSRTAQQFRDDYDKAPATFNVAEYAKKHDIAYGRVYGAIVKHVGGVDKVGKAAPKAKKA